MSLLIHKMRSETLTLATSVAYATVLGAPPGMNMVEIEVPSATKENISLILTPRLKHIWFYDDSATTKYTDITQNLSDRNGTTDSGASLNSMQTADFLYVGSKKRFRGVAIDVLNTNGLGTATATWSYYNGTSYVTTSATDGTLSTSTLRVDGLVTWTVPTDWAKTTVSFNGETSESMYWVRMAVSANLTDTSVSIAEMAGLADLIVDSANSDAEGEGYVLLQSNAQSLPPYRYYFNTNTYGGIEMKSTSITSAANINWYQVTSE